MLRELGVQVSITTGDSTTASTNTITGTGTGTTFVMDEWHDFESYHCPKPRLSPLALKIKQNQGIDLHAQRQARRTLQAQQKHLLTGNCRRR